MFLFVPLVVVVLFSFHETGALSFPFEGFSLRWYRDVFSSFEFREALKNSAIVATVVPQRSPCCSPRGAYGLSRWPRGCEGPMSLLFFLPLTLPGLFLGISMLVFFARIDVKLSLVTVVLAHLVYVFPYFLLIAVAALDRLDPALEESAADLGASPWVVFRRVTLPQIWPVLVGATASRVRALLRRVHHHVLRDRIRLDAPDVHLVEPAPDGRSVDQYDLHPAHGDHAAPLGRSRSSFTVRGARGRAGGPQRRSWRRRDGGGTASTGSSSGVTHRYGEVDALDDVSLEIGEGELITLLGPSGCGKTTLLRIVAGFIRPSEGRVLLGGEDVTRCRRTSVRSTWSSSARRCSRTSTSSRTWRSACGSPGAEGRGRPGGGEALALVQLDGYEQPRSHELSGGRCSASRSRARS